MGYRVGMAPGAISRPAWPGAQGVDVLKPQQQQPAGKQFTAFTAMGRNSAGEKGVRQSGKGQLVSIITKLPPAPHASGPVSIPPPPKIQAHQAVPAPITQAVGVPAPDSPKAQKTEPYSVGQALARMRSLIQPVNSQEQQVCTQDWNVPA